MNNRTMKRLSTATLLGLLGLLVLAGPTSGAPRDSLFGDGNRAYYAGDYAGAITCYETVARQDGVSPALLYNLARAYQDNGDLGHALLNFERAHWLAPRDAGIRAGLHRLQQDAAVFTDADPRWARPFLGLSLNEWSWLAAAAWAVIGGLILAQGLGVKRFPFKSALAGSGLLLAMSLGGIATRLAQSDRAVVIADHASLRVSPYAAAKQVAAISEGKPLTVTGSHGTFHKVRTASGQTGWMAASEVGRVTALDAAPPGDAAEIVSVEGPGPDATDAGSGG
jgi:tetratricopeptide (TPR) repeat protein